MNGIHNLCLHSDKKVLKQQNNATQSASKHTDTLIASGHQVVTKDQHKRHGGEPGANSGWT
jgi:hypothetical protein